MPDVPRRLPDVFDDGPRSSPDSDSLRSLRAPRKPVILAGNALQLELDEPDNPFSTDDVLVSPYASSPDTSPQRPRSAPADGTGTANPAPTASAHHLSHSMDAARPLARVRFRSRVRITSGLRHHRERTHSVDSSASDSPSSSISVPLRYHADENSVRGPIGQRLSVLAANAWQKRRLAAAVTQDVVYATQPQANGTQGERAALLDRRTRTTAYGARREDQQVEVEATAADDERDEDAYLVALREEENMTFGRWPWRLFNRHWWWWQVESSTCCYCSDEYDVDE